MLVCAVQPIRAASLVLTQHYRVVRVDVHIIKSGLVLDEVSADTNWGCISNILLRLAVSLHTSYGSFFLTPKLGMLPSFCVSAQWKIFWYSLGSSSFVDMSVDWVRILLVYARC